MSRQHLDAVMKCVFGEAWAAYEKAKAKERQQVRKGNQPGADNQGNISLVDPMQKRDAIGARVGVSGRILVLSSRLVMAEDGVRNGEGIDSKKLRNNPSSRGGKHVDYVRCG